MKILFVGDLRSPFIQQDLKLLQENHQIRPFDLAVHATSLNKIPWYLINTLLEAPQVQATDLVYIWFADYPALPFMVLAKIYGKKTVVNIGGWEVYKSKEMNYGNQLNPWRGAATRWILRNASYNIVPSNAYRHIVSELEPHAARIAVIPNWVPQELYRNNPPIQKKDRAITAYCTNAVRNLKGIPDFENVQRQSRFEMKVIKNVPHEQLIREMREAKVYCQLSWTESFGVTLLEAMACGCVPVVTSRDALPDVVGMAGIIVPFGDVHLIFEAIKKAMTMDGAAARDRAEFMSVMGISLRKTLLDSIASGLPYLLEDE